MKRRNRVDLCSSRRTFLKGAASAICLPLLPSLSSAQEAAAMAAPKRFAFVTFGNGVHPRAWSARRAGTSIALGPGLRPLQAHRDKAIALSGLHIFDEPFQLGPHPHIYGFTNILSGAHFDPEKGIAGQSFDQLLAHHLAKDTPVHSIQAAVGPFKRSPLMGLPSWAARSVSWRSATTPLAPVDRPSVLFEQLFGLNRNPGGKSIFDQSIDELKAIRAAVNPEDGSRLDAFTDAVRDLEKEIYAPSDKSPDVPVDNLSDIEGTIRQFNRLIATAFAADITRVATFVLTPDLSDRRMGFIEGVPDDSLYALSKFGADAQKGQAFSLTNAWHASQIADLVGILKGTSDTYSANLLDQTVVFTTPTMNDSSKLDASNLTGLIFGGEGLGLRSRQFIPLRRPHDRRICNLYLSLLNRFGIEAESFGNSQGKIRQIG